MFTVFLLNYVSVITSDRAGETGNRGFVCIRKPELAVKRGKES